MARWPMAERGEGSEVDFHISYKSFTSLLDVTSQRILFSENLIVGEGLWGSARPAGLGGPLAQKARARRLMKMPGACSKRRKRIGDVKITLCPKMVDSLMHSPGPCQYQTSLPLVRFCPPPSPSRLYMAPNMPQGNVGEC